MLERRAELGVCKNLESMTLLKDNIDFSITSAAAAGGLCGIIAGRSSSVWQGNGNTTMSFAHIIIFNISTENG